MRTMLTIAALMLCGSLQAAESFLDEGESAKLQPHPTVAGVSRFVAPGTDPGRYSKLLVGSVTFYFAEASKSKDIDADEMKQISDAMKAAMVNAALGKVEVALSPGPGAAVVNVAITQIDMQNKKRGLMSYSPVGLVVSTVGNLSGMRMQLRNAKIEGELVDSVSGEVVSLFRVDDIGDWDDKKGLSWEDVRTGFETVLAKAITASRS